MLKPTAVPPMPSTTFVARRPGPFSALVQAAEIGGVRLEPLAPVRVHDRYFDTEAGDLMRRGLSLRVREQGGQRTVGLRWIEPSEAPLPPDQDLLGDDHRVPGRLDLPPGPLAAAVGGATGGAPLEALVSLRQYRTPRVAHIGDLRLGVLSFDVLVYEVPGARVVSNEVEVEDEDDLLERLADVFREEGLEEAARSKFARAVLRLPRTLAQPALLLPDELRQLEAAAAAPDVQRRRRASVALLDARGFRPDTIAAQTGLSMARVKHWRQRFREVRLGVLDPEPDAVPSRRPAARVAAVRPSEPSEERQARPPTAARLRPAADETPPDASSPATGDGLPGDPGGAADMAELLELFSPGIPDTPLLGDDPIVADREDDDQAAEEPQGPPLHPPASTEPIGDVVSADLPAPIRNPYPVILGPVPTPPRLAPTGGDAESLAPPTPGEPPTGAPAPARVPPAPVAPSPAAPNQTESPTDEAAQDPFAEVDLAALRRHRSVGARYQAVEESPPDRPSGDGQTGEPAATSRPVPEPLEGDTPLLEATRRALGGQLGAFESQAQAFLGSRAPSDARRLLIAAQRLRLTVETFEQSLPPQAAARLVTALRPLVDDLDAGLDYARGAALAPHRTDLARLSGASVTSAAARLGSGRHLAWGERSRRLLAHLDRQRDRGLLRSDFGPVPPDDFVGEPGEVPTPTRLRHILASTIWTRFETIRAFQDDLDRPTPALAAHLAVALSALRFVLGLVEGTGEGYVADVAAALDAAEREVAQARHRAVGAALGVAPGTVLHELAAVRHVWGEVTAPAFRKRLATVAASV